MKLSVLARHRAGTSKLMHRMFDVVVILKGLDGALEIVVGTALLFVRTGAIMALATAATARELSEDPHDFVANLLSGVAEPERPRYWLGSHCFGAQGGRLRPNWQGSPEVCLRRVLPYLP
ncbi:MAG TPA: DUF2127 domain-containing protein [Candidatus Angelobacter sp.]|nr:DUF2127 domain-containing protein [Candidatus Angelobacter sp.]